MSTHLRPKHGITSSSGSSSGPTETAKAQMNLPISVTKTSQLRVSDTMFVKGPLSYNSPRAEYYISYYRIHYKGHEALFT